MRDYPLLHLIVRYGALGAALASIVAFALIAWVGYPILGWPAVPVALFVAVLTYVIGKSYAELVRLITDMLLPR